MSRTLESHDTHQPPHDDRFPADPTCSVCGMPRLAYLSVCRECLGALPDELCSAKVLETITTG